MKIFISYTTRDPYVQLNFLHSVAEVVANFGDPFVDLIHNNATDKQAHVESKLVAADLMLLISSESVPKSQWVQWELQKAKSEQIPILSVPIMINNKMVDYLTLLRSLLSHEIMK